MNSSAASGLHPGSLTGSKKGKFFGGESPWPGMMTSSVFPGLPSWWWWARQHWQRVLLPASGYEAGSLVKGVVKTGLTVKDTVVGLVAETGEQLSDLVAEAKAEHYARKPKA